MASLLRPSPKYAPPLWPFISFLVVSTLLSFAATVGGPACLVGRLLRGNCSASLLELSVPPSRVAFARQSLLLGAFSSAEPHSPFWCFVLQFDKPSGEVVACRLPIETDKACNTHTHTHTHTHTCSQHFQSQYNCKHVNVCSRMRTFIFMHSVISICLF